MASDPNCVFCKIVAGEIPCMRVFEDDSTLAFLDIGPLAEGHVLVIPKGHYEHLDDMQSDVVASLASHFPKLGKAVMKATAAQGYNVLQNNGAEAGQEVPHVHFHIIPRSDSDGLGYRWNASKYDEGRAEEVQSAVQKALAEV
jgi:histidine triad (HIT) family protein